MEGCKLLVLLFKDKEKVLFQKVVKRLFMLMQLYQVIFFNLRVKHIRKKGLNERVKHFNTIFRKGIWMVPVKVDE
jgi:hypothetical protein